MQNNALVTEALKEYNPDAKIYVVVNNKKHPFTISYGGSDGCTKETCESVLLCVDELSNNEADTKEEK